MNLNLNLSIVLIENEWAMFAERPESEIQFVDAKIPLKDWQGTFLTAEKRQNTKNCFEWTHPEVTFKFEESYRVSGYALVDESFKIWHMERFNGGPFKIPAAGGTISITPKLQIESK